MRLLGATPIEAVGSTVPAILPGAISGSYRYAREGLVDWRVALGTGLPGVCFALAGAWLSDLVGGGALMVMTAALMLWSGISVVRGGRASRTLEPSVAEGPAGAVGAASLDDSDGADGRSAARDDAPRRWWLLGLVGAGSGFVAGLLGVGGGIVMVPAMAGPLGVPMKKAVASSLVAVAIFSVPALIAHAALGHINWTYALPLMLGVIPGAQIGARLTIRVSEDTIRRLFGVMVIVLAIVYGATELVALF